MSLCAQCSLNVNVLECGGVVTAVLEMNPILQDAWRRDLRLLPGQNYLMRSNVVAGDGVNSKR